METLLIGTEGDNYTGYTGADIKSYKFAKDSNYVYVMVDFYDGAPNEALGQREAYAYQFHFAYAPENGIDDLGVFYDGSKWDIHYLKGVLTESSVAVGSVIELQIPRNKLPNSFDFILQIGTGSGIDGVLGDITEWKTLQVTVPAGLSGTVTSEVSSESGTTAYVLVWPAGSEPGIENEPVAGAVVTIGGTYTITNTFDGSPLPPATYDVYAATGEIPEEEPPSNLVIRDVRKDITVNSGEITQGINFTLHQGGTLQGTVIDSTSPGWNLTGYSYRFYYH